MKASDKFRRGKEGPRARDTTTVGRPRKAHKAPKPEPEAPRVPKVRVPEIELSEKAQLFLSSDLVIPDGVGACSDLLYQLREQRLVLNRHIAALAEKEAALQQHIIHTLPQSDSTGVRGKISQANIVSKEVPTARSWDKIFTYVKKKQAWDLLQHRLNDAAVAARWEAGEKIPGVTKFIVKKVSCTKLGGSK